MLADVAVLSENILDGPADKIREASVDYTIVGGAVAHPQN
jgi:hypothetical protein